MVVHNWILFIVEPDQRIITVFDPMRQYTGRSVPGGGCNVLGDLAVELNTWIGTEGQWAISYYHLKYSSYDLVTAGSDTGIAVLAAMQHLEQDLIPLYQIPDFPLMRKSKFITIY